MFDTMTERDLDIATRVADGAYYLLPTNQLSIQRTLKTLLAERAMWLAARGPMPDPSGIEGALPPGFGK